MTITPAVLLDNDIAQLLDQYVQNHDQTKAEFIQEVVTTRLLELNREADETRQLQETH